MDLPTILRFNRFFEANFSCVFPDLFHPIVRFSLTTLIHKITQHNILVGFCNFRLLVLFLSVHRVLTACSSLYLYTFLFEHYFLSEFLIETKLFVLMFLFYLFPIPLLKKTIVGIYLNSIILPAVIWMVRSKAAQEIVLTFKTKDFNFCYA